MPAPVEYPIRTARLLLRPPELADVPDMLAYRSRADVCRYVPFEPMDAQEMTRRIEQVWTARELTDEGQHLTLAMQLADSGGSSPVIGDVVLMWHSRIHGLGEVGWVINPAYSGVGYATEAVRCVVTLGFRAVGLHRVVARIDARNTASVRLAERIGMRREAHLVENEWFKGEWIDEFDYAVLAREWAQSGGGSTRP